MAGMRTWPRQLPHRLVSVALAASAVGQQTWTVAANGGGQFTDIAAAVAAAGEGDIILVQPGIYTSFAIQGSRARA